MTKKYKISDSVSFIGQLSDKPIGEMSTIVGKVIDQYSDKEMQNILNTKENCYEIEDNNYTRYLVLETDIINK